MGIIKNEDGTYTYTDSIDVSKTLSQTDLLAEKETLNSNIDAYNVRIAEIDALLAEMDALESEA